MRGGPNGLASQHSRLVVLLRLTPDKSRSSSEKRLDDTPMFVLHTMAAEIPAGKRPTPGHNSSK
jgi:hypothetical protein